MPNIRLLVVEDEDAVREMLVLVLEQAGFVIETAADTHQANKLMYKSIPDLIVLDWMLPGISGIEWAKTVKRDKAFRDVPIILLTARSEESDKLQGFESGADDYLTKPFSPRELVARINAILRRAGKLDLQATVRAGALTLNTEAHQVSIDGVSVPISPTEYRLLYFFMTNPDKVKSRNQLLDQIWGRNTYIEERTVDVHIRRLRKVLDQHGCADLIQTVRGFGYRFSAGE